MMRTSLSALSCALVLFTAPAWSAPSWSGRYIYEEYAGKTAGGTPIVVTHQLQLWKNQKGWQGKLESNGYQTFIDIVCRGEARGNKFAVNFARPGSSTLGREHKAGDLLFTLEQRPKRGKTSLITRWGKFKPVAITTYPQSGKFFQLEK